MPTTISVSPAVPDKLVVNGVDLLNRDELSSSQQRELQRYIDANAHLLGFLDKEKEEKEKELEEGRRKAFGAVIPRHNESGDLLSAHSARTLEDNATGESPRKYDSGAHPPPRKYESFSLDRGRPAVGARSSLDLSSPPLLYGRPPSATQSLNRAGSPSSEYGKRKGVSWSDVVEPSSPTPRMHSHSPQPISYQRNPDKFDSLGTLDDSGHHDYARERESRTQQRSPAYSTSDKRRTPYDPQRDSAYYTSPSPWSTWDRHTRDGSKDRENDGQGWRGFPKADLPTYSTLEKKPDDFNPFQTHLHREEAIGLRKSQEKDENIKFSGYGDHRVSGLEIKHKRWQGGELVNDPEIMKKSLKPRRLFYSPIGDGVVAADGIEMKRPPPDLSPRRYVYHQRYVEQGRGEPGVRVTEKTWHEGGDGPGDGDAGRRGGPTPNDGLGDGRGDRRPGDGDDGRGKGKGDGGPRAWPGLDDDGRGRKGPTDLGDKGPLANGGLPSLSDGLGGPGKFPLDDGGLGRGPKDDGLGRRPDSGLSNGSLPSGPPREGWTITFIANPRECINTYGTETLTNIFDLEDHTPKTITTIKETFSPARDVPIGDEQ